MTLVDTNVVIDLLSKDPEWFAWSSERFAELRLRGPLYINEIGYAELAVHIQAQSDLEHALATLHLELQRTPASALFAAGQAFRRYRSAGGPRRTILPDFFIGAHAHVAALAILTRDTRRYRTYFPDVTLIAP